MSVGKTPSKENRPNMRATSAEKGAYPSPTRKLSFGQSHATGFGSPDRSAAPD